MADIGRTIGGRYKLVEELGEDEIASIFRARDVETKTDVELRALHPDLANDHEFVAELRLQTRAAARLDHPSIISVYDFGGDAKGVYLITELVEGQDLGSLLRRNGPVPARRAASVTSLVADAVSAAHEQGLVHGGLRSSKVLVTRDAEIKVGDFGLARALAECANPPEPDAEQATYQSPEQARGRRATDASDIYSLGVLLFELLTGTGPWQGETAEEIATAKLASPNPKPSAVRRGIPAEIEKICLKAMSEDATRRYGSAAALAETLQEAIEAIDAQHATAESEAGVAELEGEGEEEPAPPRPGTRLAPVLPPPPLPQAPMVRRANPLAPVEYSADDYAAPPVAPMARAGRAEVPSRYVAEDRYAAPLSSRSSIGAARRAPRRINPVEAETEADDDPQPVSVWAWVAGFLALFLITLIGLTVYLLLNRNSPSGTVVYAPNLVDMNFATAQQTAQQYQLQIVPTYAANNTDKPDNTVVDQSPPASSLMHRGDTIYVTVVGGAPTVNVPNIVGLTEADARNALTSAGLQPGNKGEAYDASVPEGSVVSSNPYAGSQVAKGTAVDFVVSKGPQPTPTPPPTPTPTPSPTNTPIATDTPAAT